MSALQMTLVLWISLLLRLGWATSLELLLIQQELPTAVSTRRSGHTTTIIPASIHYHSFPSKNPNPLINQNRLFTLQPYWIEVGALLTSFTGFTSDGSVPFWSHVYTLRVMGSLKYSQMEPSLVLLGHVAIFIRPNVSTTHYFEWSGY